MRVSSTIVPMAAILRAWRVSRSTLPAPERVARGGPLPGAAPAGIADAQGIVARPSPGEPRADVVLRWQFGGEGGRSGVARAEHRAAHGRETEAGIKGLVGGIVVVQEEVGMREALDAAPHEVGAEPMPLV